MTTEKRSEEATSTQERTANRSRADKLSQLRSAVARKRLQARGACIVRNKTLEAGGDANQPITAVEYRTFQEAFDFLNRTFFEGKLPQILITLQRHARAKGYFSRNRFQRRENREAQIHEIALNPDAFAGRTDEEILSTLLHEMVHLWQEEYGDTGRGRYHNREWGGKMLALGLMPSSTGKPDGAMTGDRMSHYIVEDGPFSVACRTFLEGARLVWESAVDEDKSRAARRSKTKFTCPNCRRKAWGAPSSFLACGVCSKDFGELIPMMNGARNPDTPNTPQGSESLDGYDRVIATLTEAVQKMKRVGVTLEDFLPALVDFTVMVGLQIRGEECVRAFVTRMESRIEDWHAGKFPTNDAEADESQDAEATES